jgi:serine/threonine protein kinase
MPEPAHRIDLGFQPGDVLAGKYRVERVLGVGGMGIVVAAHHVKLDSRVAIKFLLPEMLANPEAVARFAREAKAAVKFSSEHVARVLDVGELDSGAPYMVMEFLEGGDLATWLKQRGPLPIELAVEFVVHACVAVAEAHGLGIVHRDLKPANLFCVRRPDGQLSVKVLDFGISKATDPTATGLGMTKATAVMGSPLYMSPEQMQSTRDVDAQTDIWALGIILYELVAGRVPFEGETATEVAVKVATQPPPPVRSFRSDLPPGLEGVVLKCLEKDRRNRYANVAELALALTPFAPKRARDSIGRIAGTIQAAGLSASALTMPPSPLISGTIASPGTNAPVGSTGPSARAPRTGALLVLVLLGTMAIGAGAAFIVRGGTLPHSFTPSTSASRDAALLGSADASSASLPVVAVAMSPTSAGAEGGAASPVPTPQKTAATPVWPPTTHPTTTPPPSSPVNPVNPGNAGAGPPDCDPPFTLDAQGRKHFKPECYR